MWQVLSVICGEDACKGGVMIREIKIKEQSFQKIYQNVKTTEIVKCIVATYGPEPVGYGGEEIIEKSFELTGRGIRYLCYEHRY
jgi:hypothetical protein